MATSKKRPASSTGIAFTGPAQQPFDNFLDLARFSLDTNSANWRNYDNPDSCIIPPLFYYKKADKSDQDYESARAELAALDIDPGAKSKAKPDEFSLVKHRGSDEAEHIVYKAIEQLIQKKIQASFVAVHGFNMDRVKHMLPALFPWMKPATVEAAKAAFREYDFLLIGPKIGIILIEVKASHFTQKKDFRKGNRFLPDDYLKGLQQLKSFDSVVSLLQECAGFEVGIGNIRKVLFTPNLRKSRFREWYSDLEAASKEIVDKNLKNADVCWFAEDMDSPRKNTDMWSLCKPFRKLIESCSNFQSSQSIYEIYCPLIVGLASVTILPNQAVGLKTEKISEGEALMRESERVEANDPLRKLDPGEEPTGTATAPKRPQKEIAVLPDTVKLDKVVILTPEQKAALEGPNRQFIVGPAGVGKTIILQAKALELLKEGKSVFIFCPPWFKPKYKELFDQHGITNYSIEPSWVDLVEGIDVSRVIDGVEDVDLAAHRYVMDQLQDSVLSERLKNVKFTKVLSNYDGIFIDDMMDRCAWNIGNNGDGSYEWELFSRTVDGHLSVILMAFAKIFAPSKTVWVAFDFWTNHQRFISNEVYTRTQRLINKFLNSETERSAEVDNYYTITKLTRVMRCSENVFRTAYDFGGNFGPVVKPQLGHKIQGKKSIVKFSCKSEEEALELCWEKIKKILNELSIKNISFDNVCLLAGYGWTSLEAAQSYFLKKCEEDGLPACVLLRYNPLTFEHTASVGKCSPDKGILRIYWSNEVSSSEWPIVIFVDYRNLGQLFQHPADVPRNYRARSRATAELIEITAIETPDIPKRHRSLSDSIGTRSSYITTTRSRFEKSELAQLGNMAGSVALLARLDLWIRAMSSEPRFLQGYCRLLRFRTRRRHYSVSEIDLDKKVKLHPTELKNLRKFGVPLMWDYT